MKPDRSLLSSGLALVLAALFAGVSIPLLTNPRMGLSAHLGGLLNGLLLAVVAFALPHLALSPSQASWARRLLQFGTWVNFTGVALGAMLGTSEVTPIAGAGFHGSAATEMLVSAMLASTIPTMIPALALLTWGAMKRPKEG